VAMAVNAHSKIHIVGARYHYQDWLGCLDAKSETSDY